MSRYAETTSVPVERTKAEVEKTLERYGATHFVSGWGNGTAVIGFTMKGVTIRIELPLPEAPKEGSPVAKQKGHAQLHRQRWRALLLIVKAKLEAVESQVTTFEKEWLGFIVLPGGQTVGDQVLADVRKAIATGQPAQLLIGMGGGR